MIGFDLVFGHEWPLFLYVSIGVAIRVSSGSIGFGRAALELPSGLIGFDRVFGLVGFGSFVSFFFLPGFIGTDGHFFLVVIGFFRLHRVSSGSSSRLDRVSSGSIGFLPGFCLRFPFLWILGFHQVLHRGPIGFHQVRSGFNGFSRSALGFPSGSIGFDWVRKGCGPVSMMWFENETNRVR